MNLGGRLGHCVFPEGGEIEKLRTELVDSSKRPGSNNNVLPYI